MWNTVGGSVLEGSLIGESLQVHSCSTAQLVSIIQSVCLSRCLFVRLFAVNAKTNARIDAKRSGITKNNPERFHCGLK